MILFRSLHRFCFLSIPIGLLVFTVKGYEAYVASKVSFLLLLIAGMCFLGTFRIAQKKSLSVLWNKGVVVVLGLFMGSLVMSTVFSQAPIQSLFGVYGNFLGLFMGVVLLGIFCVALQMFRDKSLRKQFLQLVLALGLFVALYALLQRIGWDPFQLSASDRFLGRSYAVFGHPNVLGKWLLFPLMTALVYGYAYSVDVSKSWRYVIVALVLFGGLLASWNRASFLGLGVSGLLLLMYGKSRKLQWVAVVSALILGVGGLFVIDFELRTVFSRAALWESAVQGLDASTMLFGSGLGTAYQVLIENLQPSLFVVENLYTTPSHVHNAYLEVLIEQGLFGMMVLIALAGCLILVYAKRRLSTVFSQSAFFSVVAIAVSLIFSFPTTEHLVMLALFLALLLKETLSFDELRVNVSDVFRWASGFIVGMIGLVLLVSGVQLFRWDLQLADVQRAFLEGDGSAYERFVQLSEEMPFALPSRMGYALFSTSGADVEGFLTRHQYITDADVFAQLQALDAFYRSGNLEGADERYDALVERYPVLPALQTQTGLFESSIGRCEQAREKLLQVQALLPEQANWAGYRDIQKRDAFRIYAEDNPQYFRFVEAVRNCTRPS